MAGLYVMLGGIILIFLLGIIFCSHRECYPRKKEKPEAKDAEDASPLGSLQ